MSFDAVTIERMVREVLNQLQPPAGVRDVPAPIQKTLLTIPATPVAALKVAPTPVSPTVQAVVLRERVVTADLLKENAQPGWKVVIAKHAILTPAAQDYLKNYRIAFERSDTTAAGTSVATAHWKVLLSSVSDHAVRAVDAVCRQRNQVQKELVGGGFEAAGVAVSAINRADVAGVIVLTTTPDLVACRANRSSSIRAAVVTDITAWPKVEIQLRPNVVCLSPHGRGFMEIQNIVTKVVTGLVPEVPLDWV